MPGIISTYRKSEAAKIRRLRKALKAAELLDCYDLQPGVSNALFSSLLVEGLHNAKKASEALSRRREEFRGSELLNRRSMRTALCRVRDAGIPGMANDADRYLNLNEHLGRLGEPYIKRAKRQAELLDPVLVLYALFKFLTKRPRKRKSDQHDRGYETLDWYVRHYFPKILDAAGIKPTRGARWTQSNIDRHYRRAGGEKAVRQIAGLMLSTDPALIPYRPHPTFKDGIRPMMGEYMLAIEGRMRYRT